MVCFKGLFLVLFLFQFAKAEETFFGHEVWRVEASAIDLKDTIFKYSLDVWSEGPSNFDVMVTPEDKDEVRSILQKKKINHRVVINDIQFLLDQHSLIREANPREFGYDKYNNFTEIEDELFAIDQNNPNATLVSLGLSFEGRDLWQLQFATGGNKPIAWFDCGIHAREWISPATCLYGINRFDQNDPQFSPLLDAYDVHIIPVGNPDGYEWTWIDNRLWRKNRNDNSNVEEKPTNTSCYGVDLNRNFDAYWGGLGTSNATCSSTYRGVAPASEIETQNVQNAINANVPKVFFTIHAYSQYWMYPYSYDYVLPQEPLLSELDRVAEIGVDALTATFGTNYTYGPIAYTIYPAAGSSVDYAFDLGSNYSYAMELRDEGEFGFLLPEDQIIPTAIETWNGFIAAIEAIP